jgi:hypothetical protein
MMERYYILIPVDSRLMRSIPGAPALGERGYLSHRDEAIRQAVVLPPGALVRGQSFNDWGRKYTMTVDLPAGSTITVKPRLVQVGFMREIRDKGT